MIRLCECGEHPALIWTASGQWQVRCVCGKHGEADEWRQPAIANWGKLIRAPREKRFRFSRGGTLA